MNAEWPILSTYSRAQALEDGELVDAGELARESGFRFPVALTRAAWCRCVELTPAAEEKGQDERGRLWDVLAMLRYAIRTARAGTTELSFTVLVVTDGGRPRPVRLRGVSGPGDDAEPVLTVMLPEES